MRCLHSLRSVDMTGDWFTVYCLLFTVDRPHLRDPFALANLIPP